MVIERITGGKPQEVRQTEKVERQRAEQSSETAAKKSGVQSTTAEVSDRSKAAIKAYRLASEAKPDIARASKVAQIKSQIVKGTYQVNSSDVADSIVSDVIKGV